ncbi:zinc finger protein VAR3, chloroplastic isoform X2 [Abrus precatorius]|uniref:Zinc finger protein VAR3, chloroplastic isoform X2 n=1 Tax=Abrus precatorius TaxID=3816 RepID=A0A8B8L1T5_ABRPR|nr:zinc finger protein VAR3, chloroplastic isoform X2 [Abrus precatorius]
MKLHLTLPTKMGGAAPRFLFLLSTPLPLLRHSHRHRHHKLLFLSSSSLSHRYFSSSPFSSSPLTLKIKASQQQHQHLHTQSHTSLLPEWSRFLSHVSSAGYLPSFSDHSFAAELPQPFLRDATACLAFARDRPNLLRLLSTRDIALVVEHCSPFLFRDAEDSVRKMKSFLSNCNANVIDTDRANTVDLMKFMLSYASIPFVSSERNTLCNTDLVESSVRNLFAELFKLSYSAPGPNSFDSVQTQTTGTFGQAKPPGQKIEMKRGDWICPRCNFMNFARNVKCLECEEARPKRQLAGGEWECPQCDFYNYGRNMTCLRCDCKRPGQISVDATNTMSHVGYKNGNNSDVDARLATNEEKAQRWFSKVSQLDSSADINSVIADEDFPEIMPLRKGVNRFVVSTRKTPLERRLANAQYKKNLANNGTSGIEDSEAGDSINSHDTLDDILGHSAGIPQSDNKNIVAEQKASGDSLPSSASNTSLFKDVRGSSTGTVIPVPFKKVVLDTDVGYTSLGGSTQLSNNNSTNQDIVKDKEKEEAEKSERWFRKVAELHDVPDLTSAVSDEDFPDIMPMRKGENRFVVSKKKDRSLTTPAYKRRLAMEQSGNTNFVPFVPFPPDYFAKKDKQQAGGTDSRDRSNDDSSSISEVAKKPAEMLDDGARPGHSPKPSEQSSNNNHFGSIYGATPSGNSRQSFNQDHSPKPSEQSSNNNHVGSLYGATPSGNSRQSFNQDPVPSLTTGSASPGPASENQSVRSEWTGKSLEGSAVKEPDPLDMSEEAKAERWFRRVAQIKDISELSQIPDEDFPSIMPMRKGVNRFVVSKRKTPLERRLTSQQYRRNLPTVNSDPIKTENEGS